MMVGGMRLFRCSFCSRSSLGSVVKLRGACELFLRGEILYFENEVNSSSNLCLLKVAVLRNVRFSKLSLQKQWLFEGMWLWPLDDLIMTSFCAALMLILALIASSTLMLFLYCEFVL